MIVLSQGKGIRRMNFKCEAVNRDDEKSHEVKVETFRGYDSSNIVAGLLGDSSLTTYARVECECGWHAYWKFAK